MSVPIIETGGKRLLFIHVPKTGGSAVEAYFAGAISFARSHDKAIDSPCIPRHYHGKLLANLFSKSSFDYAFMVVRDPLARMISDYRYYVKRKRLEARPPSFSFWLRYRMLRARLDPYYMDNHFRPQVDFECFDARVFRYEDGLDRCLQTVASEAGLEPPGMLPRVNVSPDIEVRPSRSDIAIVRDRFRGDYERYGY